MSVRNKFLIILGVIFTAALTYYFISTPSNKDLILIGTVDSNQIIVSPQVNGRLAKLLVDEGTPVKQGDLIAALDPSELEAEATLAENTRQEQILISQAQLAKTVWASTSNYFRAGTGKIVSQWPFGPTPYILATKLLRRIAVKLS